MIDNMNDLSLVKHAPGAPGLRLFGLGPMFLPKKGIAKLQLLLKKNSFWAKSRNQKDIRKMLSKSQVIVSIWKKNKLIAFGRATSDEIFRAVLWDIVVDKNYQHTGLGTLIINTILANNLISKVERVYVMTTRCDEFYSEMGFRLEKNQTLMIRQTS
tara:strand:- start:521 stop:991 length:471 start_codon:yes stop_codon:yes gene_type:complete